MNIQTWPVQAISDTHIFPSTPPSLNDGGVRQCVRVAKGERRAVSFCVWSEEPLDKLTVRGEWIAVDSGEIYRDVMPSIDIRYAMVWWQAGVSTVWTPKPILQSELLVKDPRFVVPSSTVGVNEYPTDQVDAEVLQPIDLPANHTQQYWIDIVVPSNCTHGDYQFSLALSVGGEIVERVTVEINVLPFTLPASDMIYSMFYRAHLDPNVAPKLQQHVKSKRDYFADLKNMKAHGITQPSIYEFIDSPYFEDAIKLRRLAGVCVDPLFHSRLDVGLNFGVTDLQTREIEFLKAKLKCEKLGIKQIYGYATDEAHGKKVNEQFPYWSLASKYDVGILATTYWPHIHDLHERADGRIDIAVINQGYPQKAGLPEIIASWRNMGVDVWRYEISSSQLPDRVRRRSGLELVDSGFSGCCNYAYQTPDGPDIWTDEDGGGDGRDCCYTYPGGGGPIDTRHYEGLAAGVVDTQYVTLLKLLGGSVPSLDGELDNVRAEMQSEIMHRLYF